MLLYSSRVQTMSPPLTSITTPRMSDWDVAQRRITAEERAASLSQLPRGDNNTRRFSIESVYSDVASIHDHEDGLPGGSSGGSPWALPPPAAAAAAPIGSSARRPSDSEATVTSIAAAAQHHRRSHLHSQLQLATADVARLQQELAAVQHERDAAAAAGAVLATETAELRQAKAAAVAKAAEARADAKAAEKMAGSLQVGSSNPAHYHPTPTRSVLIPDRSTVSS
jgi:hypothetical protein